MKPEDVKDIIDRIRSMAGDPEAAHSLEDNMRDKVLHAIATGGYGEASKLADYALASSDIVFPRWCA